MPAVSFHNIDKSFGAVAALRDVTFSVERGEAHAIVGENGAGKSTLLKILAGDLRPDRGDLRIDDTPVSLTGARDALVRGIGLVPQEMLAFPNLTVAANIFAGREITGRFGALREREMHRRARELLARLRLPVSPDALVESLPIAYRQLLQVARALAFDCRTLALDEPTTSLTAAETDHLFAILDELKKTGVTIIYVSHRLAEVFRLCDRITALRDGRYVTTFDRAAATHDGVVQAMVGRVIPARAPKLPTLPKVPTVPGVPRVPEVPASLLQVEHLTRRPCFQDISLTVAPGEIVGVFGLVGSGRTELLETLVGLIPADGGTVRLGGEVVHFRSPRDAARRGLVLVPEDRQRQGLFFNFSLRHNLALPLAEARRVRVVRAAERELTAGLIRRWGIKAASPDVTPDAVSGGNQQKIVVAKWLAVSPRVLLLDEPTKGVDVGAKYEIHGIVRQLAAGRAGCLMVSSDLPEMLALADRILVMREGRLCGEIAADAADEEGVMRLATTAPGAAA